MLKIVVPATAANLGPGFDCVGLALNLYNEIYFSVPGERELPPGTTLLHEGSLVHRAWDFVGRQTGQKRPSLNIAIKAAIPRARGLGSSASLIIAGVVAANYWHDLGLTTEKIISLASEIEGHPDNVAPALVGGLVLSVTTPSGIKYIKIESPSSWVVVAVVPDFKLATKASRQVLPEVVPYEDAIFNLGRFGLLISSFLTENNQLLELAMADRLHQPYRLPLVPGLQEVMSMAVEAGAWGSCLSGAGPTVLAFCTEKADVLSKVMVATWREYGISAETYLLKVASNGAEWGDLS